MYRIVSFNDDAFLILVYKRMNMMFQFQKLAGLWIPSTSISVETGCSPCSSTTSEINRSIATNIFCSFATLIPRIFLLSGSKAATHHIQMYFDPTLITVSSFVYNILGEIFFEDCIFESNSK
jgi:hypothetical protein